MFLHETGEDSDSFSRQDLSSLNAGQRPSQPGPSQPTHSQPHAPPQQASQPVAAASQPMHRQGSKDETVSRSGSTDASALPSSASWANKDAQANLNRRTSLAASRSSPSPRTGNASVASQRSEEPKREEPSSRAKEKQPAQTASAPSEAGPSQSSSRKSSIDTSDTVVSLLNRLLKDITSPDFKFVFSTTVLTAEELRVLENFPCLLDIHGGLKRRIKREKDEVSRAKEEEERAKQEAEAQNIQQATAMVEDENLEAGSLQLGGEPEERHDPRSATGRMSEPQSAIQPPSQHGLVGSPLSLNQNFSSLSINGRSITPQQLMLLKANTNQSSGLMDQFQPFGGSAFDHGESNRSLFQHQMPHASGQGHARHSSRFSFAGDSSNKNANTRILGHQSSMMQSNPLGATNTQNPLGSHLYGSGIQHPPPGLKTAGTPPISGGGMFGQGHGFTSASNPLGLGGNFGNKDTSTDLMRDMQQGRGNIGGHGIGQSHDTSKREYTFPSYRFPSPSSTQAPALGLLGSFYGSQPGSYHELGQLKQKKKGKKHRHANTSSFGGGVVDLADPNILRARTHQGGAGAGQGLYGGQGQGGFLQSNSMYGGGFGRGW
jgi:CCR4-NOT transcription complex subunit 4